MERNELLNLNQCCVRMRLGDNSVVSPFMNDRRVNAVVSNAARSIMNKNPEYDFKTLKDTAKYEMWDEIRTKYVAASDIKKGDNLVLRYIKSITYNRLLNFVKSEKSLRWTNEGYVKNFDTIQSNTPDDDRGEIHNIEDPEPENPEECVLQAEELEVLNKTINVLLHTKNRRGNHILEQSHVFMVMLKIRYGFSNEKISKILESQFDVLCSVSWISNTINNTIRLLKEEVNKQI